MAPKSKLLLLLAPSHSRPSWHLPLGSVRFARLIGQLSDCSLELPWLVCPRQRCSCLLLQLERDRLLARARRSINQRAPLSLSLLKVGSSSSLVLGPDLRELKLKLKLGLLGVILAPTFERRLVLRSDSKRQKRSK